MKVAIRSIILAFLALCAHGLAEAQREQSRDNLVKEFETTKVFWQQFVVAKMLVLVPLLRDEDINYKVAWALGEIGDEQAIGPLIEALGDKNSDVRVIAIQALEKLRAVAALPHLQALLNDHEKAHFGDQISVSEAAKAAIVALETKR